MQGLFYVLTFVGCLIALIIIDKFVNRGIKEEFLKKLEDDWGKVNQSKLKEEDFDDLLSLVYSWEGGVVGSKDFRLDALAIISKAE